MINIKNSNKITLFFFFFAMGLIATFIVLDIYFNTYNIKKKLLDSALVKIENKEVFLSNSIKTPENILYSLEASENFKRYLDDKERYKDEINDIFYILVNQNPNIMQLRYINAEGLEKIRVYRNSKNSTILSAKNQLQNKASRYYFKDSLNKPYHKTWLSNLDLNMEYGNVEVPYKPTIRAILPLEKDNKFSGILIINYFMEDILKELLKSPFYNIILANELSYALVHYEKDKSWQYYKEKKESLNAEYIKLFKSIKKEPYFLGDNYIAKKLSIELPNKLVLILSIKESYLKNHQDDILIHYTIVGAIILVLAMIMSLIFSIYLKKLFLILQKTKSLNSNLYKRVEEKDKELDKKEKQYQDILESISDFIWEVDLEGRYLYVSPQVEKILGYKADELIGKRVFSFMPSYEVKRVKTIFEKIAKDKKPIIQLKNINICKDGTLIYLETSGNPIFDEEGSLIGYRGVDRDITIKVNNEKIIEENHKKIEELNKYLEIKVDEEVEKNHQKDIQLFSQSKMAAMGDMIGNIAHQWRQPLSAISMVASGVKLNYEFGKLDKDIIPSEMDKIVEQTQYLSSTIDTFMNFLKAKKEFKRVDIKETIALAIKIVKSSLSNNYITLEDNLDKSDTMEIVTIPSQLQEVIINIINNSKDAIKQRKIEKGFIKIELVKQSDSVIIKIEDNGGGIEEDILPRIFEPYFTTKHTSQGTGLGLHMAYRVISESLEGKIFAENTKEGVVFTMELPNIKIDE